MEQGMFGKGGENGTTRTFFLGKNNYPDYFLNVATSFSIYSENY
jgi:hypothetical protein